MGQRKAPETYFTVLSFLTKLNFLPLLHNLLESYLYRNMNSYISFKYFNHASYKDSTNLQNYDILLRVK